MLLGGLTDVFVVGELDLEEQTTKVFIPLDYLVECLGECLHLLTLIVRSLFESVRELSLQVEGISCDEALIRFKLALRMSGRLGVAFVPCL